MYESKDVMVSHPSHYKSKNGMEVIDVIEAFTSELKGIEATDTGNVIKYICRWKNKNGIQDLEKAEWYLVHLIFQILLVLVATMQFLLSNVGRINNYECENYNK